VEASDADGNGFGGGLFSIKDTSEERSEDHEGVFIPLYDWPEVETMSVP